MPNLHRKEEKKMGRPPHGGRGLKCVIVDITNNFNVSPSPRRAWIEISLGQIGLTDIKLSPSPRRAWIEINCFGYGSQFHTVALPTEGVD